MHYDLEGKCALFKGFGGINLEDIAASRCFEIERRLKELCDIPVFHDEQHGTAIVAAAALINAIKVTGKEMGRLTIVVNGAGAAGWYRYRKAPDPHGLWKYCHVRHPRYHL